MRADEVQAMVARCLVDPGFLASTAALQSRGPAGATDRDLAPRLEALALFRGFITAIKHNGLRRIAPLTFRLLHACNLEVAFFAAIAPAYQQARRDGPLPLPQLFAQFEEQLAAYLPQVEGEMGCALGAVLRHEGNVWRTASEPPKEARGAGPRLAPGSRVAHFQVDVLALCADLSRDPLAPPPAVMRRDQFLFYQPNGQETRTFEIDALSAAVVSGLDGGRSLDEVCAGMAQALGFLTPELVATLIEDAAGHDMVLIGADEGAG